MTVKLELDMLLGHRPAAQARPVSAAPGQRLRILVLGNFSGRTGPQGELLQRRPQSIDIDNFDAVLAGLACGLRLRLPGDATDTIDFALRSLEDFEPDALYAHMHLFARLRGLRAGLADPVTFDHAARELRDPPSGSLTGSSLPAVVPAEDDSTTLARLLGRPVAAASAAAGGFAGSLERLLRELVAPHIQPATAHLQLPLIESVDRAVSATMRTLLRHPAWLELESAWRSVDQLLRRVDGDTITLELLDVRADECLADLAQAEGDASRTALAQQMAERVQRDGPTAVPTIVAGLYEFGHSAPEITLLAGLGALASQWGAVFLAAATPALPGLASTAAPGDPLYWRPEPAGLARWNALRASWVAGHIGLVFPRLLGRQAYGPRAQPVTSFAFDELGDGFEHERLAWRPAVLDAVTLLAQAHAERGWAMQPEMQTLIDDLPAYVDRSGEEPRLQACAEAYLSERQAAALSRAGLMPLVSEAGAPRARLARWQSIAADGSALAGRWQA